jgi:predicted Zn-dependent protease
LPQFYKFFSTHPLPEERIRLLKATIKEKGYPIKEVKPLKFSISKLGGEK